MGKLEDRRLRELERKAEGAAFDSALSKLDPDELGHVVDWYGPALEADAAGVRRPDPTPPQAQAVTKLHRLAEEAYREGDSELYSPAEPGEYLW